MLTEEDTIAAIATPVGEGGISIIRVSGPDSITIVNQIFQAKKNIDLKDVRSHSIVYGHIFDFQGKNFLDEVLVTVMKAPKSFTAEDTVEINCHGGIVPTRKILQNVLQAGARLAEPGEFSKRAFLNGRIDLAQAESVIDIIRSKTDAGLKVAVNQLSGVLSEKVQIYRQSLLEILAYIEAVIDFPEDDIENLPLETIKDRTVKLINGLNQLVNNAQVGKVYREGISTVIIGKPNVGKSSLLNALLRENRAIVSDIPGTTRDVIEEVINLRGIPLKIIDTAGIRETEDLIEKIGVEKSKESFDKADLVLFVLDAATGLTDEDNQILKMLLDKKVIIVINKIDLKEADLAEFKVLQNLKYPQIKTSVVEEIGIENLYDTIEEMVFQGQISSSEDILVSNIRHLEILEAARDFLTDALNNIENQVPSDLVSIDFKAAWEKLGAITGDTVEEDLLDQIFANFCIGK